LAERPDALGVRLVVYVNNLKEKGNINRPIRVVSEHTLENQWCPTGKTPFFRNIMRRIFKFHPINASKQMNICNEYFLRFASAADLVLF